MKKRLLSILLLCCMTLTLFPVSALAEDEGMNEAPMCICTEACTEEAINYDCPVCGVEGAEACGCAEGIIVINAADDDDDTDNADEADDTDEADDADDADDTDETDDADDADDADESGDTDNGDEGSNSDTDDIDAANEIDTLELDEEDLISVYSGETMSDELYDYLSYATFTLSASEYQCGEAGHTGSITDICLNSVDLSDWDANRKIKVNFDISFKCDTPGCPRARTWDRYDKTRTFTDPDSCHTPVYATANYRKACSSNNDDLIVLTLTSDKSIAYKEYFDEKEATCTEAGHEAYWMCGSDFDGNKCRKIFSDEDCTNELSAPVEIPATGHYFGPNAHHDAQPGTCKDTGNVEYYQCSRCSKYFTDDKGTAEITDIRLPIDKNNHASPPQYTTDEIKHAARYSCCGATTPAERHTFYDGSCEECGYEAVFRVGNEYYGSYTEAMAAFAEDGAFGLVVVRSYDGTIDIDDINVSGKNLQIGERGSRDVYVSAININGVSIKVYNFGEVGSLTNNGAASLQGLSRGGRYGSIQNNVGTVGELLGNLVVYKTDDGEYLRPTDELCRNSSIQNVYVLPAPIYVEISGAGKGSGDDYDPQYALTVKAGDTVTLKSDAYTIVSYSGTVTTSWDFGALPEESIEASYSGGSGSELKLKDLTPGTYTLVCTVTSVYESSVFSVHATVTLTVEAAPVPTSYLLTFDSNGGGGGPGMIFRGDNTFTVPDEIPTRGGYHFAGWADDKDPAAAQYQPGDKIIITEGNEKTVYAVWKQHGIDEDDDGFCDGGECLHEKDTEGYCTADGCTHNADGHDCCPKKDSRIEIERKGSISISKAYDGTTEGTLNKINYTDGTNYVTLTDEGESANCTITAVYDTPNVGDRIVTVTVTLTDEAAKQYKFKNGTAAETFTIDGYIDKAVPHPTLNTTKTDFLVGDWLSGPFSVTGVMEDAEVTYRCASDPTHVSSEYDSSNEEILRFTLATGAGELWVYATTEETTNYYAGRTDPVKITVHNFCTVQFDGNGGSMPISDKSRKVPWGWAYGELPVLNREGYDFNGWYTEREGGTKIGATDTVPENTTEQTLYAHWTTSLPAIHVDPDSVYEKTYDGSDAASNTAAALKFLDGDGNEVSVSENEITVIDAKFNSPNVKGAKSVTGKITLTVVGEGKYVLEQTEFTISGKINKAVPSLTYPTLSKTIYGGDVYGWNFGSSNLTGGSAAIIAGDGSSLTVPGTFAFDNSQIDPYMIMTAGNHHLPALFTPQDSGNIASVNFTVDVDVLCRTFVNVSDTYLYPDYGTAFDDLNLPDSVTVNAVGGSGDGGIGFNRPVEITWDATGYDPYKLEEQFVYGTFDVSAWEDSVEFPEGADVRVRLRITVKPPVQTETEITELPVFRWSRRSDGGTFSLPDNTIFVDTKFEVGTYYDQTGTLTGGKAKIRGTDTDISGTFSFEKTRTFFSFEGTENVTVVFTPDDSLFYAEAKATLPISVIKFTLAKMYSSVSVTDKDEGTDFDALGLPKYVSFYTEDGMITSVGVEWNSADYDKDSTDEQTITGTLKYDERDEGTLYPTTLTAAATVKLRHVHAYTQQIQKPGALKTAATCAENAVYYLSCRCGEISADDTEVFAAENSALGHDYGSWTPNGDGTHTGFCSRDASHTTTDACSGSTWKSDVNEHWQECTLCHVKKDVGAHADSNNDHLCDICSKKLTDHTGGTATCIKKAVCDVCGEEYGELAPHSFTAETADAKYIKTAATCTAKAVYHKSCAVCGAAGTETFEYGELAPHSFTAETADVKYLKSAATCTAKEVYYKSCAACGLSSKSTADEATFEAGNALGHDYGSWTSNGDGTHTGVCSRDVSHNTTDNCSGGEATCTAKAVCAVCGKEYGTVDPDKHTGKEEWAVTANTHEKKWSCCGKVTVPVEEHSFGEWVVAKRPTYSQLGIMTHICDLCAYEESEYIPATGGGKTPQTGDDSSLGLWSLLMCTSLTGALSLTAFGFKRRTKKKQ